ncbi:MAG TPA: translation initiation factor IF-1 [Bryobacteraceae bacterium]|nr:translation initiation factor IF-1 [Bryobacteraceae bacterium]
MGSDEAVGPQGQDAGQEPDRVVAEVLAELPQAKWRVRLNDRREVLAHAGAASAVNFVRLRPGDRVEVVLSPHDPGRGRITKLLKER